MAQLVHTVAVPTALAYVPATQLLQEYALETEKSPVAQLLHAVEDVAPVLWRYLPAAHATHAFKLADAA